MNLPTEFFTPQSALTLTGAVGITYVVSNTCQAVFNFNPRWLALLIALVVAIVGVWSTGGRALDYLFGVVNGCLIYSGATGVSSISGKNSGATRGLGATPAAPDARGFFAPWW